MKRQHEGEIAKMVSLLEEYKCKNDKTVAAKDEEIKEIRKTILKESHDQSVSIIIFSYIHKKPISYMSNLPLE